MIKSKKLSSHNIKHGFFNKKGGVSKGIYQSLNCGPGSNDNKRAINKNLDIVRKKINKNTNKIYLVKQIHSSKFVFIDKNQNKAVEIATEIINSFEKKYEEKWLNMMRDKLGLSGVDEKDKYLILDLLTWMHQEKMDYTNTFCHLMNFEVANKENFKKAEFENWKKRWKERLKVKNNTSEKYLKLMRSVNPLVIPRNHKVEEVLNEAINGNIEPFNKFLEILNKPYLQQEDTINYQTPLYSNEKYQTFCGT